MVTPGYTVDSKIIISLRNPIEIVYSQYLSLKSMNFHQGLSFNEFLDFSEKKILEDEFFIDNIIEGGFYSKHIKKFLEYFPENQIKIIIFEEYIKNPTLMINSILEFLGVGKIIKFKPVSKNAYRVPQNSLSKSILDSSFIRQASRKFIPSKTRSNFGDKFLVKESVRPSLDSSDRERLRSIFQDDVDELGNILRVELPWSDFK